MRKKSMKLLCLVLALAMALTFVAACNKDEPEASAPSASASASAEPSQSQSPAVSESPSAPSTESSAPPPPPAAEAKTIVVGYSNFSQKFSPFFAKTAYDRDAVDMTQVLLIINDRAGNIIMNGIAGETLPYNGVDYFYNNIADISINQKPDGSVDYNIKLREDIVFSDGVPMTIDDVIFSLYVSCDPTYDGASTFYAMPVTGMNNYRTGVSDEIYTKYFDIAEGILDAGPDNTDFSGWTQAQQDAFWGEYLNKAGLVFTQEIIDYVVGGYAVSYADRFELCYNDEATFGMRMWGFGSPERETVGEEEVINEETGEPEVDDDGEVVMRPVYEYTGNFITAVTGTVYNMAAGQFPTVQDYWDEILEAYDWDLEDVEDETAGSSIIDLVVSYFISGEGPKDPAAGGEITNIAGVKKTGDYSMTVTTDSFDATSIYNFGFEVAPLHYYGDKSMYDYNNDKFGFPKGDLSIVKAKTTVPLGAGPYKFINYENGVISYEANENYFKGEPKTKYMRFREVIDADKLAGLVAGTIDITNPSFNDETVAAIKNYNSNGAITGDVIVTSTVDNLGYGYIGIAAHNVNVGGEWASEASKNLRKGLGTVFAVYRNTVINSYYGDRASVIQYPISNTSWAAPRPNDPGYREAYSVDVNGAPIYTSAMTEAQRYDAALIACVGFLQAAGYTWNDGTMQFTAAPAGASLTYEVIIPADGGGDHPAYGILTAAKEAFAIIGITLEINDPANSNVLWDSLDAGTQELWCAAWGATIDPDMYQVYHSSNYVGQGGTDSNHYHVADAELDDLIMEARTSADQSFRKATYRRCLEILMDWAVEIPNYQRQNAFIFSPDRVKMETVTPDITTFWDWLHDLELIEAA